MSDEPINFLVANVTKQDGTKHFSQGTKVYCFAPQWGDGYENIKVIGRHRGSGRKNKLVLMVIRSKYLGNWRYKLVHTPEVLRLLRVRGFIEWKSQENIESMAKYQNGLIESENDGN